MVTWANDVLVEAPRLQELGPAWKPLCPTDWSCERNNFGATVKPVHLAIEAAQIGIFDQVAVSVRVLRLPGHRDDLRETQTVTEQRAVVCSARNRPAPLKPAAAPATWRSAR